MSKKLLTEDLSRSGLTTTDAKKLGFSLLTKLQTSKLVKKSFVSYKIPYYDTNGKETEFFRIRFLECTIPFGKKKALRYTQPYDEMPRLYFPKLTNWKKVVKDTETPIIITEGEKKAAKACKSGLPTIGLGGVWNWKSKKHGLNKIPDFNLVDWQDRDVRLIFDSDLATNPNVYQALMALCEMLTDLGARPSITRLPNTDEKIGLDDYLCVHTVDELLALDTDSYELASELWRINKEFAIIEHPVSVLNLRNSELVSATEFTSVLCADRRHFITIETEKGTKLKEFKSAVEWLKWPLRRYYNGITYHPGAEQVTDDNKYNSWVPLSFEPRKPKKNELDPYFRLRDHLLAGEQEHIPWFEQWCAYPLMYPGTKLFSAVMLQGVRHGTGKSLLGMTIGKLYGGNYKIVEHKQIYSDFNQWAKNRQFILGDEISGTDKRAEADHIKNLITRPEIEINSKGVKQYYVPDFINYFFTSNHPDALYIEPDDRRFFVVSVDGKPMADAVYDKYDKWLASQDGVAALLWYYQNEVDLSNFNPKGHAPRTHSKEHMISLSMSSVDQFAWSLANAPDQVLQLDNKVIYGDLWTASDLLKVYDPLASKGKEISLGKALSKAGFRQHHLSNHALRVYAIRNTEKWHQASYAEKINHYQKTRGHTIGLAVMDGGKQKEKKY